MPDSVQIRQQIADVEYWLNKIRPDRTRRKADKYAAANIKVVELENRDDGKSSIQ
jgi:hypothetical protein